MTTQYTQQQIIYALSSIANSPSDRHGTVNELESYARTVITKVFSDSGVTALIGEWQLVWGPKVYQATGSSVADNAMYVAQSKTDVTQFVVAISGTNPISAYGWIVEDTEINPTVPWPYGSASPAIKGNISHGTSVGLNVLLGTLSDNNLTLFNYLANQVTNHQNPLSITVTGHSLGGALSPAVALALADTQGLASGWDVHATATLSVLPTAGPTPGNISWRNYYDQRIGATTNRLWNAIDVVPHAWQQSLLNEIPTIYAPTIPENDLVKALVDIAKANSTLAGDMQQICPSVPGLPGMVDTSITLSSKNLVSLLETLLANDLLDKLVKAIGLSADIIALVKAVIDDYIKHLNKQVNATAKLDAASLMAVGSDNRVKLLAHASHISRFFENFLGFLIQLAYQHTTAYDELLGTSTYADIVSAIKAKIA